MLPDIIYVILYMYIGSFRSPRKCSRSIKASNEKKVFDDFLITNWLEKTFLSKLTWNIVPLREKTWILLCKNYQWYNNCRHTCILIFIYSLTKKIIKVSRQPLKYRIRLPDSQPSSPILCKIKSPLHLTS